MILLLSTLAIVFGAVCVWLMVRIVNRRERWAKWTLVAVVGVPVLYVLSFGPACWLAPSRHYPMFPQPQKLAPGFYSPLGIVMQHGPRPIAKALEWYAEAGGGQVLVPTGMGE